MSDELRKPSVPASVPPSGPPPAPDDEFVPADDAIIGRAFRWSLVAFVIIGGIVGASVWLLRRPGPPPPAVEAEYVPPKTVGEMAAAPDVRFTDVTTESGIDFVHVNGAYGDRLLPETMGGGCAFFDMDGDGDADLLLVNSTYWPDHVPAGKPLPTMALYRNDGHGRFANVTRGSGLDVSFYGMGVAVGDFDNDGDEDVYLTAVGPNRLLRNDGEGHFTDVTTATGVAGDPKEWSSSAAFCDHDNDGDLDLFVCNYVRWSREIDFEVDFRFAGTGRAYGPPMNFQGTFPYLYRNNGDGTFTDVAEAAGLHILNPATKVPMAKSLAVTPIDVDRDGLIDFVVANDTVQNFLFHNRGDGTFDECGTECGVAYDRDGKATGAMGIDAGYYRNDDALAFFIGNFANEMSSVYVSQGKPNLFADEAIVEGIGATSRRMLTFGLLLMDYDLDGRLDMLQTNGHIEDRINLIQPSQHYEQPAQLFWNCGTGPRGCFVPVPSDRVGDLYKPIVGRGSATADIDGDGDLDVIMTQSGRGSLLLRNDQKLGHHWLRVRLVGHTANRDAIGAWIEIEADGVRQRQQVMPTRSYLSQSERVVTFGLGDAKHVDSLRVIWPGRHVQTVPPPPVDRLITIEQGSDAQRTAENDAEPGAVESARIRS